MTKDMLRSAITNLKLDSGLENDLLEEVETADVIDNSLRSRILDTINSQADYLDYESQFTQKEENTYDDLQSDLAKITGINASPAY